MNYSVNANRLAQLVGGDSVGLTYGVIYLLIGFAVINLNIYVGVSWENEQPNVTSKWSVLNSFMPILGEISGDRSNF